MDPTTMPLKVEWSSVLVDCGEQCVTFCGLDPMQLLCVNSLDWMLQVMSIVLGAANYMI